MIDVVLIHFSILCLGITLNLIALILTLYLKNVQIWPPPGKFSSQFWFTWISFTYFMMGIPVLGILDYGSLEISDLFQHLFLTYAVNKKSFNYFT